MHPCMYFGHCFFAAIIINGNYRNGIKTIPFWFTLYLKTPCSWVSKSFIIGEHGFNFPCINLRIKKVDNIQVLKCNCYNVDVSDKFKPVLFGMKMNACNKTNDTIWFLKVIIFDKWTYGRCLLFHSWKISKLYSINY